MIARTHQMIRGNSGSRNTSWITSGSIEAYSHAVETASSPCSEYSQIVPPIAPPQER